jgi:transcriptional regulator with XRE-family HTH domain
MASDQGPVVQSAVPRSELVRLRKERDLTQEHVAGNLGWSASKLIKVEGGHNSVFKVDLGGDHQDSLIVPDQRLYLISQTREDGQVSFIPFSQGAHMRASRLFTPLESDGALPHLNLPQKAPSAEAEFKSSGAWLANSFVVQSRYSGCIGTFSMDGSDLQAELVVQSLPASIFSCLDVMKGNCAR